MNQTCKACGKVMSYSEQALRGHLKNTHKMSWLEYAEIYEQEKLKKINKMRKEKNEK